MDPMISIGQRNTLAKYMILSGADNYPPMLDKDLYDSWKKNGVIKTKKYAELSATEKIQADCDMKEINIILQGLPTDIYSLINHHRVANDLWKKVQLLMQDTSLTKQERECFVVPVFSPGDDTIACLKKAMAFLMAVASSSWVIVQLVQGRQGQNYSGTTYKGNATSSRGNTTSGQAKVVKCYNCQGEGHMTRQCTKPKQPRNAAWYKENAMLAEAQEAGQILDEEQLASSLTMLLSRLRISIQVPNSETYLNDMDNQSVHALQDFEQTPVMDFTDNKLSVNRNIIPFFNICKNQQAMFKDIFTEQELSDEQAFWFHILNPSIESSYTPPVIVEVPRKFTQEQANILWEIVEQAKAKQPLDSELDFACKYAIRIQELLVYVQDTCPNAIIPSA
ncbi:retrovirus-related pol polyprotein from transposon TNT 1-94 [Tanacetum coccineum]